METIVLDELLETVCEEDVTTLINVADVAAAEPARGDGFGGCRGVVMIAFEDIRSTDPELAFFSGRDFSLCAGRYDFQAHGRVEFAD